MTRKCLFFGIILIILILINLNHLSVMAGASSSTLSNPDYSFQMEYPSGWESNLDQQTNIIGICGLSLLNYDQLKGKDTETRVYVLKNDQSKNLDDFFLSGKLNSKEFIAREKKTYNSLDMLVVGYEYDPPAWGLVKYEVEAMIEVSKDIFVYIQISAMKSIDGSELNTIVESLLSSFKKK